MSVTRLAAISSIAFRQVSVCLPALALVAAAMLPLRVSAADLDVVREESPSGPRVVIEVHMGWNRPERTVVVPRDLTHYRTVLPGDDRELTGGTAAEYYALSVSACDSSRQRLVDGLRQYFQGVTRQDAIFRMRNTLAQNLGLSGQLRALLDAVTPAGYESQYFRGVGGMRISNLTQAETNALRAGQPVTEVYAQCLMTQADARALLESAYQMYEAFTGVSRRTP